MLPLMVAPFLMDGFIRCLGAVGLDTADRFGGSLGVLAFHLGIRRKVVAENLRRSLPHLSTQQRRRAARRCYASMGASFLGLCTAGRRSQAALAAVEQASPAFTKQVLGDGRVVFLTLHLGSWDLAGATVAQAAGAVNVYATPQHDSVADARINALRESLGMTVVLAAHGDRRGALRVLKGLRDGVPAGLLADQGPPRQRGVAAWFLGHAVSCHNGPAFLAQRSEARLVTGFCIRLRAGRYRFYIGRPIPTQAMEEQVLTQRGLDQLSAIIAALPGHYFWHHRRFKYPMPLPPRAEHPWQQHGLDLIFRPNFSAIVG